MDQAEKKRKLLLGGALIVTLIAVVLVEEDTDLDSTHATVQPANRSLENKPSDSNPIDYLAVDQLGQRQFNVQAGELFKSTSWIPQRVRIDTQQVATRAAPVLAVPAPTAPPLPFKYIGKIIANNKTRVFLRRSGENIVTKLGGRINDQYRIDKINEKAILFTYLPLGVQQTLMINEKKAGGFR